MLSDCSSQLLSIHNQSTKKLMLFSSYLHSTVLGTTKYRINWHRSLADLNTGAPNSIISVAKLFMHAAVIFLMASCLCLNFCTWHHYLDGANVHSFSLNEGDNVAWSVSISVCSLCCRIFTFLVWYVKINWHEVIDSKTIAVRDLELELS